MKDRLSMAIARPIRMIIRKVVMTNSICFLSRITEYLSSYTGSGGFTPNNVCILHYVGTLVPD